ncbi:MAG: hypothetical protein KAT93_02165 [Desulfuromonadales bacterium]|nr:hypothetical protein [Desulfuromonadales bacterium]
MSLLKKFFGQRDPLVQMRQFYAQQNWAAAFTAAKNIDSASISAEDQDEVTVVERQSGDNLAKLNLAEGEGEILNGNMLRARDHFQLAQEQARSPELVERVKETMASLEKKLSSTALSESGSSAPSSCGNSCGVTHETTLPPELDNLDEETRFELLLATLPAELAERYASSGDTFRKAWLATHDDDTQQALSLFDLVPEDERDALFYCERGALKARSQDHRGAHNDLQNALEVEPELFPAFDAMVVMLAGAGRLKELEGLLRGTIEEGRFKGFCWSHLAQLLMQRGDEDAALEAGSRALSTGEGVSLETVVLCSKLLEQRQRFDEAEALLSQLPIAGCGGGAHPLLAEFWLRRGQNLDRALESFKGALRQEQENPRWPLRIAQVYLARGWKSEAAEQLDRLMTRGGLPEEIISEIRETSERLRNS